MRKFRVVSIVLVCFFALAFSACDNGVTIGHVDGTGAGGGGGGAAGNPPAVHGTPVLVINQPLFTEDDAGHNLRYMGTRTVSGSGGSGSVSGGYLNFTIGTPNYLQPISQVWRFIGASFNPAGVQGRELHFTASGNGEFSAGTGVVGPWWRDSRTGLEEEVSREYIFVSDDVVVTRPRIHPGMGIDGPEAEAFTLHLRAGWNSVHVMEVYSTVGWTRTVSSADPGRPLRWYIRR